MEGPTGGIRSARPCHSARRPGPTGSPERLATTACFCLRAPRAMKVCVWTTTARGSTGRVELLSISANTGITSPVTGSGRASVSPPASPDSGPPPRRAAPARYLACSPCGRSWPRGRRGRGYCTRIGRPSPGLLPEGPDRVEEKDTNGSPCGASSGGRPEFGPSFLVSFPQSRKYLQKGSRNPTHLMELRWKRASK